MGVPAALCFTSKNSGRSRSQCFGPLSGPTDIGKHRAAVPSQIERETRQQAAGDHPPRTQAPEGNRPSWIDVNDAPDGSRAIPTATT